MEDSIIKKIRGLLDKAASTDSLPEREAFMTKAQELLAKYNIEMSKVQTFEVEGVTEIHQRYEADWEKKLVFVIAKHNFCKALSDSRNGVMMIFGKKSNIEVVQYMYNFFRSSLLSLSLSSYTSFLNEKSELAGVEVNPNSKYRTKWLFDYYMGGAFGIEAKMKEKVEEMGTYGLILIGGKEIQNYIDSRYTVGRSRGRAVEYGKGFDKGFSDGKNIQLGQAISSSSIKQIK